MISVFERIASALSEGKALSKTDLFLEAEMPNTKSNRALFQILVQHNKLIPVGKGRGRKYYLPLMTHQIPQEGEYIFLQKGDGLINFTFKEETITFPSYEECSLFMIRRLAK